MSENGKNNFELFKIGVEHEKQIDMKMKTRKMDEFIELDVEFRKFCERLH